MKWFLSFVSIWAGAILAVEHPAAALPPEVRLDNSGTSACPARQTNTKTAVLPRFSEARSFEAEGEGFEPSVRLPAHRFSRPKSAQTIGLMQGYVDGCR